MTKREIAIAALKKYPTHGIGTLADALLKKHPNVFTSSNATQRLLERILGVAGDERRHLKVLDRPKDLTPAMPVSRMKPWAPFKLDCTRLFVLPDIHIPYHDVDALTAAIKAGKKFKPDTVLLNGDLCDFSAVGFWDKDPAEKDMAGELRAIREFLIYLRKQFPEARLVLKLGNHEERWFSYIWRKAPELSEVFNDMASLLHAEKTGLEIVGDKRIIQAGKLSILHGHEYGKGSNPVGAARWAYLKGGEICLIGHFHRTSEYSFTTAHDKLVTCWSMGCLCSLNPDWLPINQWNHGFAEIEIAADGQFELTNKRIRHGRVL